MIESAEEELYREHILDHYKNPRNKVKLSRFSHFCKQNNPLCGDEVEIFLRFEKERVEEISFVGQGCAISQASASLLTEHVKKKSLAEVSSLREQDILSLLGISLSPLRQKCALLSLQTLQKALSQGNFQKVSQRGEAYGS